MDERIPCIRCSWKRCGSNVEGGFPATTCIILCYVPFDLIFVFELEKKMLLLFFQLHETLAPVAILNDTTGTLMSCAIGNTNVRVGVIIG